MWRGKTRKKWNYQWNFLFFLYFCKNKIGKMRFFDAWVGDRYKEGIENTTILIIGVQHWCDPSFWKCEVEDPIDCLNSRDGTCTVWNKYEYSKSKSNAWIDSEIKYNDKPTMPRCLLREDCGEKGEKCLVKGRRFLHCETKISVYDHIHNNEKLKRTNIFNLVFEVLRDLFENNLKVLCGIGKDDFECRDLKPENKKAYWSRIVFTNYIQHYTKFEPGGEFNEYELVKTPNEDRRNIENIIDNKFGKDKGPEIIIVLKEEKILDKILKIDRIKKLGYKYDKSKSKPQKYFILFHPRSERYKKDINDVIADYIKKIQNKKGRIKTRDIILLAECLRYYKSYDAKDKNIYEKIVQQLPNEEQKPYYKDDGSFNANRFSSNKSKRSITKEELNEFKKIMK